MEERTCPKCGGIMRKGKLIAKYSAIKDIDIFFKEKGKEKLVTYVCQSCGYVENYVVP